MVTDGFGPASETYGRTMYQFLKNVPYDHKLPLDDLLIGSSRTRSSSSLVTDSAAGATAFSCAMKSYNGAIAGMAGWLIDMIVICVYQIGEPTLI
ncbi:alkaline-phosphatase-like protein [Jimgerdemannia flammicorona]|uniref:alkaline phosphatase n=1 Tax=Jimgerdemannia flammicorona TaxID=994334 RepID=A0A433CXJ4_9FUNG|nr:alkaline-phosphatase-like protein [Jimgerdemannia flammicorona]